MTNITAIDWNLWRERYSEASFADQQAFYDLVYELHPEQARYSVKALRAFIDTIRAWPLSVVELGGWDGGFASEILPHYRHMGIWRNYEVSKRAVEASVCTDERYTAEVLRKPYWMSQHHADLFVASHVIEHLTWDHLKRVFHATHARWLYLQAPLGDSATDWTNYHGSHILEVGWAAIEEELEGRGYTLIDTLTLPGVRCFCR